MKKGSPAPQDDDPGRDMCLRVVVQILLSLLVLINFALSLSRPDPESLLRTYCPFHSKEGQVAEA